ncbi:hypothetical protein [Bacillus sp. B15-48]|uniref:hypothetical protein n=1 Tax=Bacillus sp. B15-48 TaxID=1548601 RepID=UPI00193FC645|nr:hypothetical protein [Bacillus sp. B15-48]MBM4764358.1 hypothetical protein [Bacillus sp. B15-48]
MRSLSFIIIISFILSTSSCNHFKATDKIQFNHDVVHIIFFSDDSNYSKEAAYYDAIIELKRDFPSEFNNMKVLTTDKDNKYYKFFEIDRYPAIVIYYQDEILVKINGIVTKEEIITPFSKILSHQTNKEYSTKE